MELQWNEELITIIQVLLIRIEKRQQRFKFECDEKLCEMNAEEDKNDVLLRLRGWQIHSTFTDIFFLPCKHWKKHQHYLGFHVSNTTFDMAEHSWTARNGTGSDNGEKASETVMCVYVWSSRQILKCKNVGWRRLRSLPSSLMNGVHFNYTNTAPYVAHYRKEGEIKTGTRGLWQQRKDSKLCAKWNLKEGVHRKTCQHEEWSSRGDDVKAGSN